MKRDLVLTKIWYLFLSIGMYDGGEHTPKLLHCSHTVCLQCLDRIVATFARDTGQFRCPICRELITIPRGGVQAMPPSFLVNQLLDLMARQRREVIPKCSTHHSQVFILKSGNVSFC
jgi:tripartite motif-containing protein 2/3